MKRSKAQLMHGELYNVFLNQMQFNERKMKWSVFTALLFVQLNREWSTFCFRNNLDAHVSEFARSIDALEIQFILNEKYHCRGDEAEIERKLIINRCDCSGLSNEDIADQLELEGYTELI